MPAGQPQEVQFPFSVDLTRAIASVEQFQTLVREMSTTVANAQTRMQASFNETTRAEQQVTTAATQATQAVSQTAAATQAQQTAATGLATATRAGASATTAATNATNGIAAATTRAAGAQNLFVKGFNGIKTLANILPGLGIGGAFLLIFEGIQKAAEALDLFEDKSKTVTLLSKDFREAFEGASKSVFETQTQLGVLTQRLNTSGNSFADKKAILADYNGTFGETLGYARDINELEKILVERAPSYIAALSLKAKAQAAQNLALKEQEKILQKGLEFDANEIEAKKFNTIADQFTPGFSSEKAARDRGNALIKIVETANGRISQLTKIAADAETEADKLASENKFKIQKDGDDKYQKLLEAQNKKAAAEREKARKLAEDELKEFNNLLAKLLNEEAALRAKAIPDNRAAEIAASDARFEQLKKERKREIEQAKVTEQQRADLQKEFLNFEQDATDAAAQARIEINKKYDAQELKLRQAALKAIGQLGDDNRSEEINKIKQSYIEQAAVINAGGQLTDDIRKKLADNQQRDIDNVNIKYGEERIKKQTELEIAGIKVAEKFQGQSVKVERAKQIAILDAQLSGALAQLDLLEKNGKDKNSLEVRQAQEAINNIRQALKNAQKDTPQESIFEFLGISPDAEKEIKKYSEAFKAAGQVVSDFSQVFVDAYDRQLKAKQKIIDQDNKEIDDLQSRLDKEKDLKDQGLANDFDRLQSELDAKKAQRAEDIANAEEINKRKQAAQRAQLIADTVAQGSNLITASTELFKTFSAIPIVGIPLAIAAIGLMLGTFAAAKVQAFKAIGDTPTFEKGGEVKDGHSHREGGIAMIDRKTGKEIGELQRNEFIVNADNYRRSKELVQAINNGDIWNMHPESLEDMLSNMGISLPKDQPQQMIMQVHQRDEAVRQAASGGGNSALDNIDANVSYLANQKRGEIKRWETDTHYCEQEGNTIRKVRK